MTCLNPSKLVLHNSQLILAQLFQDWLRSLDTTLITSTASHPSGPRSSIQDRRNHVEGWTRSKESGEANIKVQQWEAGV